MKRREFLEGAVTGAIGTGALAACSQASEPGAPAVHTAERVQWRMASSFPRGLDTIYGGAEVLAERVAAMTGDRFRIRSHPAGEIVPGLQVMDAVEQGTVQVGQTASYYYTGKNPALAFDCCVPFGMTARQQNAWLHEGEGLEQVRRLFADFNIITFPAGNTGSQMGGWYQRAIGSAADLKGLKMRIPGLGGEVMSRLGATVQVLAGGEIYPALRARRDRRDRVGRPLRRREARLPQGREVLPLPRVVGAGTVVVVLRPTRPSGSACRPSTRRSSRRRRRRRR